MKILYCCQHPASILIAICHKLCFFRTYEALIVAQGRGCKNDFNISFLSYNEHDIVINCCDENHLLSKLENYIADFISKNKLNFSDFSKIYCLWDVGNSWALYFSTHFIHYNLIESIDNQVYYANTEQFRKELLNPSLPLYYFNILSFKFNIFSDKNDYIDNIEFNSNKSKVTNDFILEKKECFYKEDYLDIILDKFNEALRRMYGIENFKANYPIVLLTNSVHTAALFLKNADDSKFFNWGVDTFQKNIAYFYLTTIDYVFKNIKFCVKLHPVSGLIANYLGSLNCLDTTAPFEIISRDFNECYSFFSTTTSLNHYRGKYISFGIEYSSFYYNTAFFYWIVNFFNIFSILKNSKYCLLLSGFKFNCNVANSFIKLAFAHFTYTPNFEELSNIHDKCYNMTPCCFIFDKFNSIFTEVVNIMHKDSIVFLAERYDVSHQSLDNVYYFVFKISHFTKFVTINNNIQYCSIVFKNLDNSEQILECANKILTWRLSNSDTEVSLTLISDNTNLNLLS